jgi:hypothetical protein
MTPHTDPQRAPGLARPSRGGRALDRESTRAEFDEALARLGHDQLSPLEAENAWDAFRELAAAKAQVSLVDLEAIVDDRLRAVAEQYQLLRMAMATARSMRRCGPWWRRSRSRRGWWRSPSRRSPPVPTRSPRRT